MNDEKRVAIITGGGSGIGRAGALALAKDGWCVTVAGRRAEPLAETVTRAGDAGERVLPIVTDVGDEESVKQLFAQTMNKFGRLDMVFNNAGMGTPAMPLEELTVAQWRAVVDVNLTGAFLCTQEAFRIFKAQNPQGGRIINNGSISAHVPRPFSAPYTSTKHAITGLTRSTSLDGRAYNIACGQIDIGNAVTEMTDRMVAGVPQADGSIAQEPRMDVEHVAEALLQMANLPLASNVQFMTIMATKMPFIGRG
jgi:NAD(P)-dependent dehydrogenase (short-subunit alcohol dehydrogenase family)